jgi:glycosyltransferase involved in cell wall biosynthesis
VLYVIALDPSQKFGSLEEQIFIQACAFRDRKSIFMPLFVAGPDDGCRQQYRKEGLEVAFLDLERFRLSTLGLLRGLIRDHRIDVVHWNMLAPANAYFLTLRGIGPFVRHFFTDHNSRAPAKQPAPGIVQKWIKRPVLAGYSRVLGVSQFVVDSLREQATWPTATRLVHFINTHRFEPDPAVRTEVRQRHGTGDEFVLVLVAHLIGAKGVGVAIRAIPHVSRRVVLWVIGAGEEESKLKQLCAELGLGPRVQFLGLQRHVQQFLQAADCLLCPSVWAEAAGLVNLEAQACGLPVVASRIGGIPEYIADGETGWLFPPGDGQKLAELIDRLAGDAEMCHTMGRQARRRAEQAFSIEARLEDYLNLYR